jgi:hypothetical protein
MLRRLAAGKEARVVALAVGRVQLPMKAEPGAWGHGTSLVAVPGTTCVVLSLSTGGPRSPWCVWQIWPTVTHAGRQVCQAG